MTFDSKRDIFQSTSPVWRTTAWQTRCGGCRVISIHVPRVEDDPELADEEELPFYFNPRPPCGGRHNIGFVKCFYKLFQSTSPVWRTTVPLGRGEVSKTISIHVPRVEDDVRPKHPRSDFADFNPRPPCGGRPLIDADVSFAVTFQSTSPVWRTTARR